ncbi:MAG: GWxTD domain-containing protein [Bacteroidota bacterium]
MAKPFLLKKQNKMRIYLLIFIVLLSITPAVSISQVETRGGEEVGVPKFYFEALGFASTTDGESRLDIYLQVPYEALSFIKNANIFVADYELTIGIYDSSRELVKEKVWSETIQTTSYDETISLRHYKLSHQSFLLNPGKYQTVVQIRDNQTKKSTRLSRDIELRNFSSRQFDVSDIMLLNQLNIEGDKKTIVPNILGNVSDLGDGFYLFLEIYNKVAADSVRITYNISSAKDKTFRQETVSQPLNAGSNSSFVKVSAAELPMGTYRVTLQIVPHILNTVLDLKDYIVKISRIFKVQWRGIPTSIVDLDAAIEQMVYIMERRDVERLRKLPQSEKQEAFKEIWKKRDPTPNTERNELMEEYYARVEYANKNFKHYIEGWRTDMGMVFIIFGSPNNVERHPFDINTKPYEVWYYYEINRQFVFVDNTGFGDYQLITPIWDVYQRPR